MLLLMTDLYGVPITYIYIALPSSIIQHSLLFLRRWSQQTTTKGAYLEAASRVKGSVVWFPSIWRDCNSRVHGMHCGSMCLYIYVLYRYNLNAIIYVFWYNSVFMGHGNGSLLSCHPHTSGFKPKRMQWQLLLARQSQLQAQGFKIEIKKERELKENNYIEFTIEPPNICTENLRVYPQMIKTLLAHPAYICVTSARKSPIGSLSLSLSLCLSFFLCFSLYICRINWINYGQCGHSPDDREWSWDQLERVCYCSKGCTRIFTRFDIGWAAFWIPTCIGQRRPSRWAYASFPSWCPLGVSFDCGGCQACSSSTCGRRRRHRGQRFHPLWIKGCECSTWEREKET